MIRSWIKTGAADILWRTGMDKVVGALSGARRLPLVIGYHRVVEDFASSAETAIPSLLVSRRMLERQLDWIGRRYRFVDLNELGARLTSGRAMQEPVAAITFDDGYRDFYDHALPILRKKGIPAALFVVTDFIGTARAQIHDQLYSLLTKREGHASAYQSMRKLIETQSAGALEQTIHTLKADDSTAQQDFILPVTWEMLDRIHTAGIVIGSHTKTHIVMTNETPECVLDETVASRQELERRLGTAVQHFAYPSGIYNSGSVSAVAAAGYRFGYTTCTHRSAEHPLLTVPRTLLWEGACLDSNRAFSESIMSCQVHRAFGLAARCRQQHSTSSEKVGHATH